MVAAIRTDNLRRVFGKKVAVDSLSLSVGQGESFGFLGPNGAGKSTTIKMMVGLLRPTSGSVAIAGTDVWQDPVGAKRLIGVLPEQLTLYDRLTGQEFLTFAGQLHGLADNDVHQRVSDLLEILDLTRDAGALVLDYSQGMRKKLGLAAAMIHQPRVLFLDEPFEAVDAVSQRAIRDLLRQLAAGGTTIFFSSHIMDIVERVCTRVAIVDRGRLVVDGRLDDLRAAAGPNATLEDVFLSHVGAVPTANPAWLA